MHVYIFKKSEAMLMSLKLPLSYSASHMQGDYTHDFFPLTLLKTYASLRHMPKGQRIELNLRELQGRTAALDYL